VAVRSGPILGPAASQTGFEDTEMPGQHNGGRSQELSNTQYGDL